MLNVELRALALLRIENPTPISRGTAGSSAKPSAPIGRPSSRASTIHPASSAEATSSESATHITIAAGRSASSTCPTAKKTTKRRKKMAIRHPDLSRRSLKRSR